MKERKTLVTSDTHYGHKGILTFCARPFSTTDEMDEHMIRCHNAVVEDGDTVYHLGDFSWHSKEKSKEILSRLKGNIHLIRGNHDRDWVEDIGFKSVSTYKELRFNNRHVILFHYPMVDWNGKYHGAYHLYGHTHGTVPTPTTTRSLEVGVDVIGYYPVDLNVVLDRLSGVPAPKSNPNREPSQTRE